MLRGLTPTRLILLGSALLVSGALLVVAAGNDRGIIRSSPRRIQDPQSLIPPEALSPDEAAGAGAPKDLRGNVQLDRGAWVQVAGPDGRIKQRYTAERVDPRPGHWLEMVQPRAVMHSPNGRVVALRGDRGRAHVPSRALENGRFEGNVVVSIWLPEGGRLPDPTSDAPSVVMHAAEATFDAIRNRIDAPGQVEIESPTLSFTGETLELVLSSDGRSIELLTVKRPLSPLVLTRRPATAARSADSLGWPRETATAGLPLTRDAQWCIDAQEPPAPGRPYRLDLKDQVGITQERSGVAGSMRGDRLVAYFHLTESDSGAGIVQAEPRLPLHAWFAAQALGAVADEAERVVVRFTGPLVMRPAIEEEHPPAADRMRVELDGRPVELTQAPSGLRADRVVVDLVRTPDGDQPERLVATGSARALDGKRVIESSAMEVLFDGGPGAAEPRRAILTDGVRLSDGLRTASARSADVRFNRGADEKAQPRRAELRGGVSMVEGQRTLVAGELDMDFVEADGQAQPVRARLRQEVRARDAAQVLWTSELDCTLGPIEGSVGHQLIRADASSGVQLQVKDGARVFADSLQADLVAREALLRGPGLQLVRGQVRIDQVAALRVNELERSARVNGSGRAQGFESVLLADAQAEAKAIPPKDPRIRKQFEATWAESMAFHDRVDEGALLDLKGQVAVRAEPEAGEIDLLDARAVSVEFLPRAAGPAQGNPGDERQAGGGDLRISRVIAVGGAQVQNQVWTMAAGRRTGEPRLVRLQGERLEFDLVRGDVIAPGIGSVLINNPSSSAARHAAFVGPGAEGVTRFRYADGMQLRRLEGQNYRMSMRQSVEVAHAGPRAGDTFTLTCSELDADLERPTAGSADGEMEFGGAAEIRSLTARGAVLVRSSQFECECESFEYDASTQVATMKAAPGRQVALIPAGQAVPTRAGVVRWDMAAGRLTVDGAQGGMRR